MMGAEQKPGAHEREIFLSALEISAAPDRIAFLNVACVGDETLRNRVEQLLREHQDMDQFLEAPALSGSNGFPPGASGPGGTVLIDAVTEKPGDRIGRYKLLQKIGEGGCGVVYMAEQEEPVRRRVAVKVIKLGMDTKSVIARFEAERQALAMMDHPNIAKVLDAGATETGRPFFVMELVRGVRITDYCDQNHLPTEERLKLFTQACQAIQHAHQKGIIHRDIKPSNLLVTLHDGQPVPKVIDFGIAKATEQRLTDKTLFTEFSAFIGTPAYMSPEQAEMSDLDIDTRSDIYSLGVLLYELLTGKTPFDAEGLLRAGLDECRRTIREVEPARPSTRLSTMLAADLTTTAQQRRTEGLRLVHLLRGDLDWVVMKCLEKDRSRRYDTANDLVKDVQRYLESEPVLARPPSNIYRMKKLVRRHRTAFSAAAAILVTLLIGAAISGWQAVRATRAEHTAERAQELESQLRRQAESERARAEQQNVSARLNEYVADINLAQQSLAAGNYGRAIQLLKKHRPQPGAPDLRGFEWSYLWEICQGDEHTSLPNQHGGVQSLAFSPDGDLLAIGLAQKVNIWNIRNKSPVATIPKGGVSVAFSPDGNTLVTASPGTTRLWNTADWTERKSLIENSGPVALSADGRHLATTTRDKGISIWDTSAWKEERFLPYAHGPMAFSPSGQMLAADSKAGITLWPLDPASPEIVLHESTNVFVRSGPWMRNEGAVAWSPDGKWVLATRNTLSERGVFVISIWDAKSGNEAAVMPEDPEHIEHTAVIPSLAFSPDGTRVATASMDYSIRLWDFARRQRLITLQGHLSEVWSLAFSPDGQSIVSGAKDGSVNIWPLRSPQKDDVLEGPWQPLAFSRNGRTLAARKQGTVAFFNLATREPDDQFQIENSRSRFPPPAAVSEDLGFVVQATENGSVKIWDTQSGDSQILKVADRSVDLVALSPDGHTLITGEGGMMGPGNHRRALRWWDLRAGASTALATDAQKVLFSPDGRTMAAFRGAGSVQFWDAATRLLRTNIAIDIPSSGTSAGLPEFRFPPHTAFSSDGRLLATSGSDDAIRLWEVATGKLAGVCTGHKQAVTSVAFSPDGKTLASASDDSTLKFWNVATQQELLTVRRLGGTLRSLLFSPDGHLLVGASGFSSASGGLRFFHARPLAETDLATEEITPKQPSP